MNKKVLISIIVLILIVIIGAMVFVFANKKDETTNDENVNTSSNENKTNSEEEEEKSMYSTGKHHAIIEIKDYGTIKVEYDPKSTEVPLIKTKTLTGIVEYVQK